MISIPVYRHKVTARDIGKENIYSMIGLSKDIQKKNMQCTQATWGLASLGVAPIEC